MPAASSIATSPSMIAMNGIALVADAEQDVADVRGALLAELGQKCKLRRGQDRADRAGHGAEASCVGAGQLTAERLGSAHAPPPAASRISPSRSQESRLESSTTVNPASSSTSEW